MLPQFHRGDDEEDASEGLRGAQCGNVAIQKAGLQFGAKDLPRFTRF